MCCPITSDIESVCWDTSFHAVLEQLPALVVANWLLQAHEAQGDFKRLDLARRSYNSGWGDEMPEYRRCSALDVARTRQEQSATSSGS